MTINKNKSKNFFRKYYPNLIFKHTYKQILICIEKMKKMLIKAIY